MPIVHRGLFVKERYMDEIYLLMEWGGGCVIEWSTRWYDQQEMDGRRVGQGHDGLEQ
jgi:hypothetical protein